MANVNKVFLLGNLGRDPESKKNQNGVLRTSFTLATNDYYKSKSGEKISKTEWHQVVLWNKLAELGNKYLSKGKQVYIEGKLSSRPYEGANGEKKFITEIVATSMILLGSEKGQNFTCGSEFTSKIEDFNY